MGCIQTNRTIVVSANDKMVPEESKVVYLDESEVELKTRQKTGEAIKIKPKIKWNHR